MGDKGVLDNCGRPSLTGLSRPPALSLRALSNAAGRSLAPGGTIFLLGLPCGVASGSMKLLAAVLPVGVLDRSRLGCASSFEVPPGKMPEMKLAMLAWRLCAYVPVDSAGEIDAVRLRAIFRSEAVTDKKELRMFVLLEPEVK